MIGNIIIGFVASFFMIIMLPDSLVNGEYGGFIYIILLFGATALTYIVFPDSDKNSIDPIDSPILESNGLLTKITEPDGTVEVHIPKAYKGTQQDIENFVNGKK